MADFCRQCAQNHGFESLDDLEGLGGPDAPPLAPGYGYPAICEGCGFIMVDAAGNCIECDLFPGEPGHGHCASDRHIPAIIHRTGGPSASEVNACGVCGCRIRAIPGGWEVINE